MIPLDEIFIYIDDFCKQFESLSERNVLPNAHRKRKCLCKLCVSEVMTILIMFQLSAYRTFKDFYINCLQSHYKQAFPTLVSYNRFLELMPLAIMPLTVLLAQSPKEKTGKYFIDSTKLTVCDNYRIKRHKVFAGLAKRGKTSTGWFFGLKIHLIINHKEKIMRCKITPGNTDDRTVVPQLTAGLQGWMFGDKGYLGAKLKQKLAASNLDFITRLKRNMKKQLLDPIKKWWLDKRGIIESVIDQLKSILQIQHTRHRSIQNYFANVLAALLAYNLKPKKPSVKFTNSVAQKLTLISS